MILVTGSLAYDTIMDFPGMFSDSIMPDKIHMLNVSFLVEKMRKGFGGTAGNIAYNLSLLGIKCTVLGIVGTDFEPYRKFLDEHEVDTSYIKTAGEFYTSNAYGITDKTDNQIWGFYAGADMLSDNLSIYDVKKEIDLGIIAPHNPRAMIKFAQEYAKKKIPYLFDPGMQLPWLGPDDLKKGINGARIIIGNDYEVSVMKKRTGIQEKSPLGRKDQIVIVTLGAMGSKIEYKGETYDIPPARARTVSDPAGAGDAYRAGFVAGYLRELPMDVCGRMGSVTSVYTVEAYGTSTHKFNMQEFKSRYKENFGESLNL